VFPPNAAAPPIGGPPKPPAPGAGPGADALAPGAKAVRDAMVKALDDALKDPEFAASLETTASVEFDVSQDSIEIETDDVIAKGGDAEQPEGGKADAAPSAPKG
jgi:hypothetical protein